MGAARANITKASTICYFVTVAVFEPFAASRRRG
jgi:hypothetical protein